MQTIKRAEIAKNVIDVTDFGRASAYPESASQFLDSLPGPQGPGNFLRALDRNGADC